MTELTPEQLVDEIKEVYNVLSSLDGGAILAEPAPEKSEAAGMVKKPPIPLKDIVKAKCVVCLEYGKKLKTLKTHLRKTHGLMPKECFQRFGLDPKKLTGPRTFMENWFKLTGIAPHILLGWGTRSWSLLRLAFSAKK